MKTRLKGLSRKLNGCLCSRRKLFQSGHSETMCTSWGWSGGPVSTFQTFLITSNVMEIVDIRDFPRRAPQTPEMEESASHHLMQKLRYSGRCSEVPGSMYESLEKMTPGAKQYSQIKNFYNLCSQFRQLVQSACPTI